MKQHDVQKTMLAIFFSGWDALEDEG